MIIYPLPPEELDDATLSKQIKNIAQVLCNVHYLKAVYTPLNGKTLDDLTKDIPLPLKNNEYGLSASHDGYSKWASTCRANYLKLVEMGLACCEEYSYRFGGCVTKCIECNCIYTEESHYGLGKVHYQNLHGQDNYSCNNCRKENTVRYIAKKQHKLQPVIEWARDNVPDLPACSEYPKELSGCPATTPFQLVMQEKYKHYDTDDNDQTTAIVLSYRFYYRAILEKRTNKVKQIDCDLCKNTKAPHQIEVPAYPNPTWTRREKPSWLNLI